LLFVIFVEGKKLCYLWEYMAEKVVFS